MNRIFRKKLQDYFTTLFDLEFPHFKPKATNPKIYTKGEFLFSSPAADRELFILIEEHPKGDDLFRIEVGWSKLNRPPELSFRPQDFLLDRPGLHEAEEFFCTLLRLSELAEHFWTMDTILDARKLASNEWILETVGLYSSGPSPCNLLRDYGIPFLHKMSQ
jgi:hypothetical protein